MQSAPRRGCGRDYTGLCFRGELGTERVASPLPLHPPSTTELCLSSKRALLLLPHTELGSEPCSRSQTLPGGSEGLMCVQTSSLPMWSSVFLLHHGFGQKGCRGIAFGSVPASPAHVPKPPSQLPSSWLPPGRSGDGSKVGTHAARLPPRSLGSARVLVGANPSLLSLERRVCFFPYRCLSINRGLAWLAPCQYRGRLQQARSRGW